MKTKLFAIAAAALAIAACQKPVPEPDPDPIVMSSFAFLAENNECIAYDVEGVIAADNSVTVALPFGVTKDDLKTLIPSFELTVAEAVATVGSATVYSGVTAVDFSAPVDIVFATEKVNAQYSINVSIESAVPFVKIAESEMETEENIVLRINPVDGNPLIAACKSGAATADRFPYVFKIDGSKVVPFYAGPIVEGRADAISFAISEEGDAYIAFNDHTAPTTAKNVTVAKVSSSAVSFVGDRGSIDNVATTYFGNALVPISANEIWYAGQDAVRSGGAVTRRALNLAKFDGSAWAQAQDCGTRDKTTQATVVYGKQIKGESYIMVIDATSFLIYKYDAAAKAWIDAPGATNFESAGRAVAKADTKYNCIDFDIDSKGNLYILACADFFEADKLQYGVIKFNTKDNTASIVGGGAIAPDYSHTATGTGCRYASMALNANDVPYVVLGNNVRYTTGADGEEVYGSVGFSFIDPDTKQWSALIPISDGFQTEGLSIGFNAEGTGYICYRNSANKHLVVYASEK